MYDEDTVRAISMKLHKELLSSNKRLIDLERELRSMSADDPCYQVFENYVLELTTEVRTITRIINEVLPH